MTDVALITGASSGIGKDLARIHAEKGRDLIIIARREEKLNALKQELENAYDVSVQVIAKDLTNANACEEIYEAVAESGTEVEYLINNAGFGGHGKFHEQDSGFQQQMIDLNIKALTKLTRLFLPQMVKRNRGRILQVASTAGFIPGPLQAVYFATKSYVLSLSQAIAEEVSDMNVTCTALCPGATETEFIERADLENTNMINAGTESSRSVAEKGYNAMMNGKLVEITSLRLKLTLEWAVPFMPRKMVLKTTRKTQEKEE
jgi:short-subunit dehydrogenase